MRLTGFTRDSVRHIGVVNGDTVRDLGTTSAFYADPVRAMEAHDGEVLDLVGLELAPAVPETSRIFCVGINYRSHSVEAKDVADLEEPKEPMIFGRWQQSLVLDGDDVPLPPNEPGLDWEVELAAIIKDEAWLVPEETALEHVLGYAAFNDLSAREKQLATSQFTLGKNADRSGPISPVVTRDEAGDPKAGLEVTTRVNGEVMQQGNTRDLIHDTAKIIAYITDTVTLLPGDVIATGTPGGVGVGRKPQVFLVEGDEVAIEVETIGTVTNRIVRR